MWPRSITDAVNGLLRLDGRMLWRVVDPEGGKTVHLTFDDGPVPEVTPWVLDTLAGLGEGDVLLHRQEHRRASGTARTHEG